MKVFLVSFLYTFNVILQAQSSSSSPTSSRPSSLCISQQTFVSLHSQECDYSSESNLGKPCIVKEDNSAWIFDKSTIHLPIAANSCALEVFPRDPEGRGYSSTYNISAIGIYFNAPTDSYHLYTESVISASNSCQFVVELISDTDNPAESCSDYKYYNLVGTTHRYFIATFRDQCLVELKGSSVYDISVTDSQTNVTRIYRIFTPSQLFADQDTPSDVSEWQTLVGVSIHFNTITVYTQLVPTSALHSYLLRITYTKGEGVQLEGSLIQWLTVNKSLVTFDSPGDLPYVIEILRCKKRSATDTSEPTNADLCESIQHYTFIASEIRTSEQDPLITGSMDITPTADNVHVIKESDTGLKKQDLYILLGTIFGVVVVVFVVIIVLLIYLRRRQGSHHGLTARFSGGNVYSDGILLEEDVKGAAPSILILYSYDCQQHLACVQALALLLQNSLGCSVMADFWATQEIAERGIYMWLQHKMSTVNYVMVVCSTGARFKCVTNRRMRLEQSADDAFLIAMRLLQSRSNSSGQRMVVYFDYSSESDVPVLLESWHRYKLQQDLELLMSTVIDDCSKDKVSSENYKDSPEKVYIQTLKEKINVAKKYMSENADWFHMNMRSDGCGDAPVNSIPPLVRASQQLPVVTVEYSGDRQQSKDQVDANHVHKPDSDLLPVSPAHTLGRRSPQRMEADLHSSVGSASSSVEDLAHDIDFILNPSLPSRAMQSLVSHPSLPSRARYVSSPHSLIDILPATLPNGSSYSPALLPQIGQLKSPANGPGVFVDRVVTQLPSSEATP